MEALNTLNEFPGLTECLFVDPDSNRFNLLKKGGFYNYTVQV